jgi:hypothetical protein
MQLNKIPVLACAAVLLGEPGCAGTHHPKVGGEQPVVTTVCDLVARPNDFNGKVIRIQARYQSDDMGLTTLTDPMCFGGVVPTGHFWDTEVSGSFFASLHKDGCLGTVGKKVTATWTGRYYWEPKNTPGTGKFPRGLDVQKIDNLEIRPIAGAPSCGIKRGNQTSSKQNMYYPMVGIV